MRIFVQEKTADRGNDYIGKPHSNKRIKHLVFYKGFRGDKKQEIYKRRKSRDSKIY
jgi:hypothetical protein